MLWSSRWRPSLAEIIGCNDGEVTMLSFSSSTRIFVCATPTDMRKQFDGLSALVTHALGHDVMSGDYFVFINRAKNRCKVLC